MLCFIGTIYKCKGKKKESEDLPNVHKILPKKTALLLALSTARDRSLKNRDSKRVANIKCSE